MLYLKKTLDQNYAFASKIFKYGLTGTLGMGIDFFMTWSLINMFSCNRFIANSFGFILASITNYLVNRVWTFKGTVSKGGKGFATFFLIGLIGLGINYLSMLILVKNGPADFYICKFVAIGIVFFWNFLANYLVTFRD